MKVSELIEMLKKHDPDMQVVDWDHDQQEPWHMTEPKLMDIHYIESENDYEECFDGHEHIKCIHCIDGKNPPVEMLVV